MNRRSFLLAAFLLAGLVAVQHAYALRLPLFADDYLFLDRVRHLGFVEALEAPDALGNFYRPLTRQAYFWVVAHAFGESAAACHAVNLLSLWAILVLLFTVVARRAGARAGVVAAIAVGAHPAWDVPILWGSGAQDLWAIGFALAAMLLCDARRPWASALAYGLALLSKEVVGLLPVALFVAAWTRERSARQALRGIVPHGVVAILWALLWWNRMPHGPNQFGAGAPTLSKALATIVHAIQVLFAAEGGPGMPLTGAALAVVAGCAAIGIAALVWFRNQPGRKEHGNVAVGVTWFVVAAAPVALVAHFWSAYYYAFALCGAALVLGEAVRRGQRFVPAAVLVLVLGGAAWSRARAPVEVPLGEWTPNSHINAGYVLRSERITGSLLASLRRLVPQPAPRTTFFFAGVPGSIAWQVADGPYVRWAYRDSSLRSYWLSDIREDRVDRGEVRILLARADTLQDAGGNPGLTFSTAGRAVLQADLGVARGALRYHLGRWPGDRRARTLLGWIAYADGNRDLSRALLGTNGGPGPRNPDVAAALARAAALRAADDSLGWRSEIERAIQLDPYDPAGHAAYVDAHFHDPRRRVRLLIEGFATTTLAPDDPRSWRRWAFLQASFGESEGALRSLARYRELGPTAAARDPGAATLDAELRRRAPYADKAGQVTLE